MPFKKGQITNPKGRPKGSSNKVTISTRQWIANLIDSNRGQFEADLQTLEPKDRLILMERLLSYCVPKMQSIEAKVDLEHLPESQIDLIINELNENLNNE